MIFSGISWPIVLVFRLIFSAGFDEEFKKKSRRSGIGEPGFKCFNLGYFYPFCAVSSYLTLIICLFATLQSLLKVMYVADLIDF